MTDLLFGSWGAPLVAYSLQHPWHIFAGVLVAALTPLMFRKNQRSSGGDFDFGGWGDGDGGGD